jgi:hypothetical protein
VTKTLTNNYNTELKAGEFISDCHFHPSLVCLLRLELTKMELLMGLYFKGRLLAFLVNKRLGKKSLNVRKTLTNIYSTDLKAIECSPYCYFHPILVCLLRLEPTKMKLLLGLYFKGRLLAFLANIRLLRKRVNGTKTLTNNYITE